MNHKSIDEPGSLLIPPLPLENGCIDLGLEYVEYLVKQDDAKLRAKLDCLDPDCNYQDWLNIGSALFRKTNGTDYGLEVWNAWSSKGKKYTSKIDLKTRWKLFTRPMTPSTLGGIDAIYNKARNTGINWIGEPPPPEPQFICGDHERIATAVTKTNSDNTNPLNQYSILGRLAELEKNTVQQTPVLGNLALKGQSTVFYSSPNSGKTLIILYLIIEAIIRQIIDPKNVYYMNMDDTAQGLFEKAALGEEYGFNMLADGHNGFKTALFIDTIIYMIENDLCRDVIIILDTLKKFVDVMSKDKASRFTKIMRMFILKGGTLIALAHTNKKPDSNGKPVYGGTSDIIDDCDCAYTLARVNGDKESTQKVVEFENIKRRGNVAQTVAYTYSLESNINYNQLLLSVTPLDPNQLKPLKQAEAIKADAELINIVKVCLLEGVNTKMRLADAVALEAGISKRSALAVIEKYTGEDPAAHQWSFVVRERGAKVYEILKGASIIPTVHDPRY